MKSTLTIGRWTGTIIMLAICTIIAAVICAQFGFAHVDILKSLDFFKTFDLSQANEDALILFGVRLPKILLAGVAGACLAASGAVLQAVLINPLADPFILGISGGAAVGAIIATVLAPIAVPFIGIIGLPLMAFIGASAAAGTVYMLSRTNGKLSVNDLLLTGIMVNSICSALIIFVLTTTTRENAQTIFNWLVGWIGLKSYGSLALVAAISLAGLVFMMSLSKDLNVITLGEAAASQTGVNVERLKISTLIGTSLITGAVVSQTGLIGFIGLLIPHVMRRITGPDHRILIPASAFGGAIFLMCCDTAASYVMAPKTIPVGVVTALIGGPVFLYILRKDRKRIA